MEINLLSVRNDKKKRLEDIQIMLDLLRNNQKTDQQLILKSAAVLMLYNLVEGVFSNLLSELFDTINQKKVQIDRLPDRLQKTIYTYYLKKIGQDPQKLKEYYGYDSTTLCALSYMEINNYLKLFSGNLDSKSIKDISYKLGVDFSNNFNEPALLKVKNFRNKLAHGETKFSNTCQDITLEEMNKLYEKIAEYLEKVIDSYEIFLNRI